MDYGHDLEFGVFLTPQFVPVRPLTAPKRLPDRPAPVQAAQPANPAVHVMPAVPATQASAATQPVSPPQPASPDDHPHHRLDSQHRQAVQPVVALAQLADQLGLDLVTVQDHPYNSGHLDAWTLLTWIAASTSRVTVAGNVLNLPLRPPAVLAQAAASLDVLSHGRTALGLGAGAMWDAIEAMGGGRKSPGQSVEALAEAVDIIRAMWNTSGRGGVRYAGQHYQLAGVARGPQSEHDIPIWLGAYRPRMLRLVGQVADGWLPSEPYLKPGDLARGNAVIDEAAVAAGRHPAQIRRLLNVLPPRAVSGQSADQAQQGNQAQHGDKTQRGDQTQRDDLWQAYTQRLTSLALTQGVGTFVLMSDDAGAIDCFASQVAPQVRKAVRDARRVSGLAPADVHRGPQVASQRVAGIDYHAMPPALAAHAVQPGDRAWADLRHNDLRSGAPGLIVRPRTVDEVVQAVNFARPHHERGVEVSVRSAGHGISGKSTNHGGIVIDVAALNAITVVDEASRRIRVGPGATWGEVALALAPRGWAITSGDYGGVGVGGLATTGGIGLLGRSQGLTIDHAVAYDLVTAQGQAVRASAEQNPDLLWAMRGAGGNFGVVTAIELTVDQVAEVISAQMAVTTTDISGVLAAWASAVMQAPRDLTSFAYISADTSAVTASDNAASSPGLSASDGAAGHLTGRAGGGQGQPVSMQTMSVWAGEDASAALIHLRKMADAVSERGTVVGHQAHRAKYTDISPPMFRPRTGGGDPAWRTALVDEVSVEVADALARLLASGVATVVQIRQSGGAACDIPVDATAYAHRSVNFCITAMGASHQALDPVWDATVEPLSRGLYLSFDTDVRPERQHSRLLAAFPEPTLSRLRALKAQWDPDNMWNANFPIPPAEATS